MAPSGDPDDAVGTEKGRRKHLGTLGAEFVRVGAPVSLLGAFLRLWLEGKLKGGNNKFCIGVVDQPCRHRLGGPLEECLRGEARISETRDSAKYPGFAAPCRSHGSGEKNKHCQTRADSLRNCARKFLRDLGYIYYEPGSEDSLPEEVDEEWLEEAAATWKDEESTKRWVISCQENGSVRFKAEDVVPGEFDPVQAEEDALVDIQSLAELMSDAGDFANESTATISTCMSVPMLGYLAQFADEPATLLREFRRLRTDSALMVLHLCGCGVCTDTTPGCVEGSHLRLGYRKENTAHTQAHALMRGCAVPDGYNAAVYACATHSDPHFHGLF